MPFMIEIRYADRPAEIRGFEQPIVTIGREQGDLALRDPLVSGRHAELRFDGQSVIFRDLNSTNGSFDHGNQRLHAPKPMLPEQGIRMGNTWIVLKPMAGAAASGGTVMMTAMPPMAPPPGMAPSAAPQFPSGRTGPAQLRLLDLRCIKQQEFGGDEPFLLVRGNKVWSHDNMKSGMSISLRGLATFPFGDEIEVTLMEKDSGRDDRLGSGTISAELLARGEQQFDWDEAGCHYQLLYEVF